MTEYIVTDLTRFSNPKEVCIAVINRKTGQCLRPLPYFKNQDVTKFNIHPGAILRGEININSSASPPTLKMLHGVKSNILVLAREMNLKKSWIQYCQNL